MNNYFSYYLCRLSAFLIGFILLFGFALPAQAAPVISIEDTPIYNATTDTVSINYVATKDPSDRTNYAYFATLVLTRTDGQQTQPSDPQYFAAIPVNPTQGVTTKQLQ